MRRTQMHVYATCEIHKPLLMRVYITFISIPLILLAIAEFKGPTIADAFHSSRDTLTTLPHVGMILLYLVIFTLLMAKYLRPMIQVWHNQRNGIISTQSERDRAMRHLNRMDRVVISFCVIGFNLGRVNELVGAARLYQETASDIFLIGFLQAWSIGLFAAVLINLTLSNILFPVRRAILLQGSTIPLRKYSFIKKIFIAFVSLLFFLLMQMALTSFDLLQTGREYLKAGMENQTITAEKDTDEGLIGKHVKSYHSARFLQNQQIRKSFSVLVLRSFFCFLLAMRLLSLLKQELRNPLVTVSSKLDILTSHGGKETGLIDIVTNDEFTPIFRAINTLIEQQGEQVQSSLDRLDSIIEHAADPVISFNDEGCILIFNPAAQRYFGKSRDEAERMILKDLFTRDEIDYCGCGEDNRAFVEYLISEQNKLRRFSGKGEGRVIHFEANISKTRSVEGPVYTAILRDISAQIEIEENLTRAKIAAENANRLKSEFLANMSHELRTPLNAVLGFTQLLMSDDTIGESQKEKIKIISRSGEHLLGLINDILDISKIEAGKAELNTSVCAIHRFLEEIHEMFTLRCEKKGLNLDIEILDTLPEYIEVDTGKLRQVIINLVGNAVKFTDEGGITLLVGVENGMIKIEVADTGRGINSDEIDHIVDPFVQSASTAHEGGTGLGLAISNSYIKMMGGELSITSEPGKGSVFSFTIALKESDAPVENAQTGTRLLSIANGSSPLVLIVDDKEHNRTILRQMLERTGFTVEEAENGEESVRINRSLKPELIFMDIRMPVMDGYAAVSAIRTDDTGHTPVIFALTASAFKQDEVKILQSGFDGYLAKPFKIASLYRLIEEKTGISFIGAEGVADSPDAAIVSPDYKKAAQAFSPELCDKILEALDINDFQAIKTIVQSIHQDDDSRAGAALLRSASQFDEVETKKIIRAINGARS